jgi:hypothetical protein
MNQSLQPFEQPGVGVRQRGLDAACDVGAQGVGVPVGQRHADHGHSQLTALDEPVERREDHLAGEVTGDAKQHQHIADGAAALEDGAVRRGTGHDEPRSTPWRIRSANKRTGRQDSTMIVMFGLIPSHRASA